MLVTGPEAPGTNLPLEVPGASLGPRSRALDLGEHLTDQCDQ
ncbi:hypothetical protein H4W30_006287 [Amycolatopsis roodepoortensis]|uniref:Uncharacterized protein n=1 Tax=Amycolatopsis roodepoortensis TaxID=700274 RepID=A0ABR9LFD8_9PSEU|nr:hypothetical protein [Amycolatopsis roodepoortensis]